MNSETNIKYSSLKRYLRDLGYGDKDARRSIKKLRAMDPALKQAFALYFNEGLHPEMAIAEITFQELTSKIKMNQVTAFLFLDWLNRDPDTALDTLRHTSPMGGGGEAHLPASRWIGEEEEEPEDCSDFP